MRSNRFDEISSSVEVATDEVMTGGAGTIGLSGCVTFDFVGLGDDTLKVGFVACLEDRYEVEF